MDILIDLIIYLIKQATKSGGAKAAPLTQQQAARQRAALARQIQAMQQGQPARKGAAKSSSARSPVVRPPALPPAAAQGTPMSQIQPAARVTRVTSRKAAMPSMRLPFILGEVLSAPVALRETEI
jgi:hypothetical protein